MWLGLSGGGRAGLTLERYSQLAIFATQLVDSNAAEVWWVKDGVHQVRLFRAPTWCPSGGGGTREAGSTVAESMVALYRVNTHQIRRGQLDRRRARGVLNPCAQTGRFLREKLISDDGLVQGPTRSGERARFVRLFQGCTGLWTAVCWLARRLQLKAPATMDLGISIFLISA